MSSDNYVTYNPFANASTRAPPPPPPPRHVHNVSNSPTPVVPSIPPPLASPSIRSPPPPTSPSIRSPPPPTSPSTSTRSASPPSPKRSLSPPLASPSGPSLYSPSHPPRSFTSSFPSNSSSSHLHVGQIIGIVVGVIGFLVVCVAAGKFLRYALSKAKKARGLKNVSSKVISLPMVQFLNDMENKNPIRFTSKQLRIATDNFKIVLGSGGFGVVYKGIISNNKHVAVKVLNGTSNKRIEEQFMAEVSIMGRTHHYNLVKLYGFCFESSLQALVYEFMINGSLDKLLFKANTGNMIGFDKLHEIAVGTARGIAYLHEECAQRIIHYDIKPGNILLDSNFCAKVADFGLAKLCSRDNTHITMTGGRGTPGYAAPELWMPLRVTHKCDVYSFGMLLFEIIGRRRNMDITLGDSQQWFPMWAWGKYERKQMRDVMIDCDIEEKDHQVVERMVKVAFCCVQYRPETRPMMSIVVKMLEGMLEVPETVNPFTHLFSGVGEPNVSLNQMMRNVSSSDCSTSMCSHETPIM